MSDQANGDNLQLLVGTEFQLKTEFADMTGTQKAHFVRMNSPFYDGEKWAVRKGGNCLTKTGEWEWEPMPSSRTDDFYERCRFESLEKALQTYLDSSNAPRQLSPDKLDAVVGTPDGKGGGR